VVGRDGLGGLDPRGVDHVAQLNGAGGEALVGEGLALGRARATPGAAKFGRLVNDLAGPEGAGRIA
jgi:hypothetical protein